MAEEVIVINEPDEIGEYCACAFCAECHFIEIESHE